jgi:hypothetical protein
MDNLKFEAYDYTIGGKMVVAKCDINELDFEHTHLWKEQVKLKLATQLAQYMIEKNLIEFMQQANPSAFSRTVVCRAYLAPSEEIKILRSARKL